jgi:hypothetical protein
MRRPLVPILLLLLAALAPAQDSDVGPSVYAFFLNLFNPSLDDYAGETVFGILRTPVGGYAEGMVGALTAYPSESSSIAFNPAASSVVDDTELSVYHNNWIGDSKVESAFYSMRFGNLGLGLGGKWFYTGFKETNDFVEPITKADYTEAMALLNVSYNIGSGYYFTGLALGANVKAAYRSVPDFANDLGIVVAGSGLDQSAIAFLADLGLLTRFNVLKFYPSRSKNAAVGVAVRDLGFPVLGEAMPTTVSLGLSYSPVRPLTFAADLTKPVNFVDLAASGDMQYSLGVEARILEFFSVQGGFQLKNGPRVSLGSSIALADVTIVVNYTLDLATQFMDANRLSIQSKINLGDGGRYALRLKVEEFYLRGIEEYAAGNIETSVELWTQALKLDPGFDPARENRRTAAKALELKKALTELQTLGG